MPEQQAYLETIRVAALAILADQPPLTEWEAGDEDDGEIMDPAVEKLLAELGWPTRTRTFTVPTTDVSFSNKRCFCRSFASSTAPSTRSGTSQSRAVRTSAFTSFGKHEPP